MSIKRIASIFTCSFLAFVFGNIIPITNLYSKYIVKNHDDENTLVAIVIMVEWPLLLLVGAIVGNWLYKKYLTNKDRL